VEYRLDQAKHISDLIKQATKYYLAGNIGGWYWTLTAIRNNINHELGTTEREDLDTLEKTCNENIGAWEKYKRSIQEGVEENGVRKTKNTFSKSTRDYNMKLFDILKDLGFFPDKEDRSKLAF